MTVAYSAPAAFDLSILPPIVSVGAAPPTTAAEYREWGYALGLRGVRPELPPGTPHSFFAAVHGGYRAGLDDRASRALLESAPTDAELAGPDPMPFPTATDRPHSSDDLVAGLLASAKWCDDQGGYLGDFLASLIRDAAGDVELFRCRSWNEFDGRRDQMIRSLSDCPECERRAWEDKR